MNPVSCEGVAVVLDPPDPGAPPTLAPDELGFNAAASAFASGVPAAAVVLVVDADAVPPLSSRYAPTAMATIIVTFIYPTLCSVFGTAHASSPAAICRSVN